MKVTGSLAKLRATGAALALAAAALLAGGCDYPEEGYYELVLHPADSGGGHTGIGQDNGSLHIPFYVRELTDDTDLTIGFDILLPRDGKLVLVPLENSDDRTRRGWSMAVGDKDSGHGDLELLLTHYEELLSFEGRFRNSPFNPVAAYQGSLPPDESPALLDPPLAVLQDGRALAYSSLDVRRISQKEFELVLGGPLARATEVRAGKPDPLPEPAVVVAEPEPTAQATEEKKPRITPGGGRGTGRS